MIKCCACSLIPRTNKPEKYKSTMPFQESKLSNTDATRRLQGTWEQHMQVQTSNHWQSTQTSTITSQNDKKWPIAFGSVRTSYWIPGVTPPWSSYVARSALGFKDWLLIDGSHDGSNPTGFHTYNWGKDHRGVSRTPGGWHLCQLRWFMVGH